MGARLSPLPAFLTGRRAMAPWGGRGLPAAPRAPLVAARRAPKKRRQPPPGLLATSANERKPGPSEGDAALPPEQVSSTCSLRFGPPGCQQARRDSALQSAALLRLLRLGSEGSVRVKARRAGAEKLAAVPFSPGLGGLPSSAGPSTEPRLPSSPTAALCCVRPGLEQLPPAGSHALPSSKYSSRRRC